MRWVVLSVMACSPALSACGSDTDAEITNKMSNKGRKNLPPPTQILVYDFAMSPGKVSADSVAAGGQKASFRCGAHIAA